MKSRTLVRLRKTTQSSLFSVWVLHTFPPHIWPSAFLQITRETYFISPNDGAFDVHFPSVIERAFPYPKIVGKSSVLSRTCFSLPLLSTWLIMRLRSTENYQLIFHIDHFNARFPCENVIGEQSTYWWEIMLFPASFSRRIHFESEKLKYYHQYGAMSQSIHFLYFNMFWKLFAVSNHVCGANLLSMKSIGRVDYG